MFLVEYVSATSTHNFPTIAAIRPRSSTTSPCFSFRHAAFFSARGHRWTRLASEIRHEPGYSRCFSTPQARILDTEDAEKAAQDITVFRRPRFTTYQEKWRRISLASDIPAGDENYLDQHISAEYDISALKEPILKDNQISAFREQREQRWRDTSEHGYKNFIRRSKFLRLLDSELPKVVLDEHEERKFRSLEKVTVLLLSEGRKPEEIAARWSQYPTITTLPAIQAYLFSTYRDRLAMRFLESFLLLPTSDWQDIAWQKYRDRLSLQRLISTLR